MCVVCGVWCVVCGVWCVVCGVWYVSCGSWFEVCEVRGVMCDVCPVLQGDSGQRRGSEVENAHTLQVRAPPVSIPLALQ